MSRATTAFSKTILQGTLDGGHGGNAGRTTSKSGHSCPCQNCPQGSSAEKTGGASQFNHLSCPPDDTIGQGTELTELELLTKRLLASDKGPIP